MPAITPQKVPVYRLELQTGTTFYKFLDYLVTKAPSGATVDQIVADTGIAKYHVENWLPKEFSRLFKNVRVVRSKDKQTISLIYSSLELEQKIIVQQSAEPAVLPPLVTAPPAPAAPEPTTQPSRIPLPIKRAEPPAQTSGTKATEIAWAKFPELQDPNRLYPEFVKPVWYDHLYQKVVVWKKHVRIYGPPGIGKSTAFEYMAAEYNHALVNINADAGLRGKQLIGGMSDLGRFEVAQFATAVVKGGWAKIDEANAMDADAALILNGILAPPHQITINGVSYPVHPGFRLCITYNPGLTGTKPIPPSLADRFYPIRVDFPDMPALKRMLKASGIDTKNDDVIKLMKYARALADERQSGKIRYDITIRRLKDAWSDLKDGHDLKKSIYYSIVASIDNVTDQRVAADLADSWVTNTVTPEDKEDGNV